MKNVRFLDSINNAAEGFIYVMRTERNMRIHFLIGVLALTLGVYFKISVGDILVLCITVGLVLACEMFNTALEHISDMIEDEYHPGVKIVKDISAGAVFVSAVNALIIGYMVFSKKVPFHINDMIEKLKQSSWHSTFIAIFLVISLVVLAKTIFGKGRPFRGGMPSGHSAFAFSLWAVIMFLTKDVTVVIISFIMAVLIARHRIRDKVHNIWEVIAGGVLGVLVTTFVFQILRLL